MSVSPNITDAHLQAVMDALPDDMDEAELCALTLTIFSTYYDDPIAVITELIASIYTYAETQGIDSRKVSKGLRTIADMRDKYDRTKKAN
jgi:hypothetical protein